MSTYTRSKHPKAKSKSGRRSQARGKKHSPPVKAVPVVPFAPDLLLADMVMGAISGFSALNLVFSLFAPTRSSDK